MRQVWQFCGPSTLHSKELQSEWKHPECLCYHRPQHRLLMFSHQFEALGCLHRRKHLAKEQRLMFCSIWALFNL